MLRIGVLGAGHLGKIHLRCIKQLPNLYHLVGFYDPNIQTARSVTEEFGIPYFPDLHSLIDSVDVVDIVTPTVSHFDCASESLKKSKHVFIEKPVVTTLSEALELIELANEAGVKVQVGHVERFNPAFLAAKPLINNPMFIEAHRLSPFSNRGTDVPVVLDLMIHDIDIVLSVVRAEVKKISASGVPVISDSHDITNARIEFDNGSVANLTASRISLKSMRKARFFQRDAYISVDFLQKELQVIRMKNIDHEPEDPLAMVIDLPNGKGKKEILIDNPPVFQNNAIVSELESFAEAIINNVTPPVTIYDGYKALEVAHRILDKIS